MKKTLLSLVLLAFVVSANSQLVLNEVYSEPGAGKSEFIELYNSSTLGAQNLDCFTILTYWEAGANTGWYVLDLPSVSVSPKGFYVLAAASPFNVQSQIGVVANLNWNNSAFRTGSDGYLQKFQRSGSSYIPAPGHTTSTVVTDLSVDVAPGVGGHNYITFVFQNGVLVNGFWGGGATGTLPAGITGMPNLTITPAGACGASFTVNFSTLGAVEFVNQSPGSDNGYARTTDGKCGSWDKTSASVNHTPGVTNGGAAGVAGALVTSQVLNCTGGPGVNTVQYNITGVSGAVTEADDFPVEVQLYYDNGVIGQLDGPDSYQSSIFDALVADPAKTFTIIQTKSVILVYKTKRGCFDKVVALANGCAPLPVDFKSFTAARNHSNVLLKWETGSERNNLGFAVERNVNGAWQEIGWVPTQAQNGNSDVTLRYSYSDVNNVKGMSQYRLRQVDIDAKMKYSEIRAVRGENQLGKTIVYPNPSNDGKVNVVFEDASVTREVSVADMSGRIVRQIKAITNNNIIIENLQPGMYTVRIVAPETGEQVVEKIVVNKR